jgi:hypothetical protein
VEDVRSELDEQDAEVGAPEVQCEEFATLCKTQKLRVTQLLCTATGPGGKKSPFAITNGQHAKIFMFASTRSRLLNENFTLVSFYFLKNIFPN